MKDLALAPLLDAVVSTGAHSLKIEGRMKSPLYVACVTDYYRRKLDGRLSPDAERTLIQDLQTIFSRPWTSLYAAGIDASPDSIIDPVSVGHRGAPIGHAELVARDQDGTRWLRFTTNRALEKHDGIQVELPDGGKPFGCAVNLLRAVGSQRLLITLPAGSAVEVALPEENVPPLPRGAPVFCSASQSVRRRYEIQNVRDSALPSGHPVNLRVSLSPTGIAVRADTALEKPGDVTAEYVLPLTLTPSRQPEQTASAVRKAFERLGDTTWQLGTLDIEDPHACYAPLSKLNEARRAVFGKLSLEWAASRARRRAAIATSQSLETATPENPAAPVCWSLKLRADAPLLPTDALNGIDSLVLSIGHTPQATLEQQLALWSSIIDPSRILLAVPLITRAPDLPQLKATIRSLAQSGWKNWECADLAGCHMLGEVYLKPASSDWSLYALNRVAAAELACMGITLHVLSPESSLDNIRALSLLPSSRTSELPNFRTSPIPELLVYQHTPLFISETAPCLPHEDEPIALSDRRGRTFVTRKIDGQWITVSSDPFCVADRLAVSGCNRFRIDLSWSPDPDTFSEVIRSVLSGERPPSAHAANFDRGLA
jgi:hypothetical protein